MKNTIALLVLLMAALLLFAAPAKALEVIAEHHYSSGDFYKSSDGTEGRRISHDTWCRSDGVLMDNKYIPLIQTVTKTYRKTPEETETITYETYRKCDFKPINWGNLYKYRREER